MTRSALVVLVPAVEPLVAQLRLLHDPMAGRGVPAHVTVLHPFLDVVGADAAEKVASVAVGIDGFSAKLSAVGRFPGEVVFLEPEPVHRFKELTAAIVRSFPECPPYGGAFADPHPHLTVGNRVAAATADRLEMALQPLLPIGFAVSQLTLLVEDDEGQWSVGQSWPFRPPL